LELPGDSSGPEKLTPLVYKELHRLAHRYMGFESPGQTLQTSALVNEAYLRLVSNQATWPGALFRDFGSFDAANSGGFRSLPASTQVRRQVQLDSPFEGV